VGQAAQKPAAQMSEMGSKGPPKTASQAAAIATLPAVQPNLDMIPETLPAAKWQREHLMDATSGISSAMVTIAVDLRQSRAQAASCWLHVSMSKVVMRHLE